MSHEESPLDLRKQPTKMKRKYTLEEKILAITRIENGEKKAAVGRDLNIPESTLRGWCKTKEKIRF